MNEYKKNFTFLKNLIKREIDYLSVTPTHALLFITYRCTSRCEMCTIWKRSKKVDTQEELTLDDWKKCIDTLIMDNVGVIELFGGDSLIRKNVTIQLIEYIKKRDENIMVDFPTNCNLLDKETALALVKVGVDRLYISLDGPIEIHDKIRGISGTFNNVQKGIEYLVEAKKERGRNKPEIIINCTISSSNVENFEQIIPIAEKLCVDTVEFEYVGEFNEENIKNTNIEGIIPTPFYVTLGSSNLLSREQAHLLKRKMKHIRESAKNSKINIATQHIDALTMENLIQGTIPNKKCYYCRYTVSMDPYGNMMGCFHFNNFLLGNIKNDTFSSIWNNKKHHKFLKYQKKGKIKICKNCISGVHRNPTIFQSMYRVAYFSLMGRGFDDP